MKSSFYFLFIEEVLSIPAWQNSPPINWKIFMCRVSNLGLYFLFIYF